MARAMAAAHGNRASTFIATAAAMADSHSRYISAHACVHMRGEKELEEREQGGRRGKGRERTVLDRSDLSSPLLRTSNSRVDRLLASYAVKSAFRGSDLFDKSRICQLCKKILLVTCK